MGAHSKPSTIRRVTALAATLAMPAVGAVALAGTAHAGPPGGWGPIIDCESGGNPTIENPSPNSSASGLFQFTDDTWASVGGSGRAKDASVEEQYMRAEMLYDSRDTQPWNASRHCWQGRTGDADIQPAPAPEPEPAPSGPVVDSGRANDGTGEYTCTTGKLSFDECDPHNIGEVVAYPLYDGHTSAQRSSSAGAYTVGVGDTLSQIAHAHGTTVARLVEINDIANPDVIFAGNSLHVG